MTRTVLYCRVNNNGGPLTPTNARGTVGSLAHEVGHALLLPGGFFSREQWVNKEAFVQRALEHEGAAVIKNIQIQQEILANGGVDKNIGERWPRSFGQFPGIFKWNAWGNHAADWIAGSVAKYASSVEV